MKATSQFLLSGLLALGLMAGPAEAGKRDAEDCLRTRVWDGYGDGWGIRTMTSTELAAGKTRNYLVTLYKGNEYRIEACGDSAVQNVDVLLYDTNGNVIKRDETEDKTPRFEFTPEETGSYYVVVYMRGLEEGKENGGVAMAVVYR